MTSASGSVRKKKQFFAIGGSADSKPLSESEWRFLKSGLHSYIPLNPAIPLVAIFPKELNHHTSVIYVNTCS